MKIIDDSMKILTFIYKKKKTNEIEINKESQLDKERVKRALRFLEQEYLISYESKRLDGIKRGIQCDSNGIKLIESPKDSQERKNIAVNFNLNIDSVFKADFESLLKLDSMFKGTLF